MTGFLRTSLKFSWLLFLVNGVSVSNATDATSAFAQPDSVANSRLDLAPIDEPAMNLDTDVEPKVAAEVVVDDSEANEAREKNGRDVEDLDYPEAAAAAEEIPTVASRNIIDAPDRPCPEEVERAILIPWIHKRR